MAVSIPQITLICTGPVKDRNLAALIAVYQTRLRHEARITVHAVKDSTRQQEGERIVALLKKEGGYSFALTEEGTLQSSRQLARRMEVITGKKVFIIGGPEGLDTTVKAAANELLSLSPLTFTHDIARLLLFEQLYRACSVMHNRQYHKD